MGGESLARGVLLLFFIHLKGMSLTCSLFCRTFFTKTWNFYGIFAFWFFKKAQKVEIKIMENNMVS
jgi:hypothetical protein